MSIAAITFDFWGTLFRDAHGEERQRSRVDAFVAATGAPREAAARALDDAYREFFRVHIEEQRTLRPSDAVRMTCETLGITTDAPTADGLSQRFATAVLAYPPVPVEGALDAVRAAAARFPAALISDTGMSPGSSLRQLLDRHGFTEHFSVLTFSDHVGVSKPKAPMFERTAFALRVAPSALFHIGDLESTDVAGIQNLGGKAGLFAGVNTRFLGHTNADYTFTDWRQFIDLLARWR